jgi:DNA recombination protein RmuC
MNSSFRQLGERVSATLTQANDQQKERLENFSQAVATLADKNEKAHEALRQVVDAKLTSVREESLAKLDEIRQMVDEKLQATLETRLGESFARVVDQLNQMHQGIGEMKTLAASVGDLKHILTNPKIRGTFGEVQLSLLLEEFLTPDQYLTNAQVREGSSERVEFAIKMPGREGNSLLLPIDAKFPLDVYQRLNAAVEMGQPDGIADCRKQLLLRIRTCAKDIRDKYIHPPSTTDFGVMFLPIESLYAEVLREPGIVEALQREFRITVASPTTLGAYLNALQMGFRTLAIEKRSSEVWQLLSAVKSEFGKYNKAVEVLSGQLNRAAASVDKLGTRTRVMSRTLKQVEASPDETEAQKLLGLTPDELSLEEVELQNPIEEAAASEIILDTAATS